MKQGPRKGLPAFRRPNARRSENMRAIRSSGNQSTEKRLSALLKTHRIHGWRCQPRNVVGKPDFVIKQKRVAIFVDGCFFHGCPRCGHIPKTNRIYWAAKIAKNKQRDKAISKTLRSFGYKVIRIWECQLKTNPSGCLYHISRGIRSHEARTLSSAHARKLSFANPKNYFAP